MKQSYFVSVQNDQQKKKTIVTAVIVMIFWWISNWVEPSYPPVRSQIDHVTTDKRALRAYSMIFVTWAFSGIYKVEKRAALYVICKDTSNECSYLVWHEER